MADLSMIERPLSSDERAGNDGITELGAADLLAVFLSQLAIKRDEYQKEYKPYDHYSARMDFEDNVRKSIADIRAVADPKILLKKVGSLIPNLDTYGEASRFELLTIKPINEDKLLDGMRQSVVIGKEFCFKAKARGNGYSIFVPNVDLAEVEARYKIEKSKKGQ